MRDLLFFFMRRLKVVYIQTLTHRYFCTFQTFLKRRKYFLWNWQKLLEEICTICKNIYLYIYISYLCIHIYIYNYICKYMYVNTHMYCKIYRDTKVKIKNEKTNVGRRIFCLLWKSASHVPYCSLRVDSFEWVNVLNICKLALLWSRTKVLLHGMPLKKNAHCVWCIICLRIKPGKEERGGGQLNKIDISGGDLKSLWNLSCLESSPFFSEVC